ncbi:MAG: sugar kinase [Arachidicoccus sp.]|nr:sugar kinase [Arachidicoccus sp.]
MNKILCFGEILLRMSPDKNTTDGFHINSFVGGAEANVALALAKWKVPVKYSTAMPDNFLSERIAQYLSERNIDTSGIIHSGKRVGLYYLNQGADLKSMSVIYDRENSSFAELKTFSVDWDVILDGVSHVHTTAISPAVSQSSADVCKELLQAAKEKNITVSIDLNYREKLWKYGKLPIDVMPALASYADIIMGNVWAANQMLGTGIDENIKNFSSQAEYVEEAKKVSGEIFTKYPNCKLVANTFRFNAHEDAVKYFAVVCNKTETAFSKEKIFENIVDRAGSGDCFMAGILYGYLHKFNLEQMVVLASAAATGKLYEKGDHTQQTIESIQENIARYE